MIEELEEDPRPLTDAARNALQEFLSQHEADIRDRANEIARGRNRNATEVSEADIKAAEDEVRRTGGLRRRRDRELWLFVAAVAFGAGFENGGSELFAGLQGSEVNFLALTAWLICLIVGGMASVWLFAQQD